jgi:hypothetical protein
MTLRDILAKCREAFATRDTPLTYPEVVALATARSMKCDGMAYDLLGFVDCGNGDTFMSLVRTSAEWGEEREERGKAFLAPLMADGVFVKTGRVVTLNTQPGPDGLAPIERASRLYEETYGVRWIDDMARIVNAAHAAAGEGHTEAPDRPGQA